MIIGIDFDNTIVCYDEVLRTTALERKLIPEHLCASKGSIRDYLCSSGLENTWTELQGYLYGPGIASATAFPGVADFFKFCRSIHVQIKIISHKTLYPYRGPRHNLRSFAHKWIAGSGLFPLKNSIDYAQNIFFESTKENKLKRICSLECDFFIDDLSEFLSENGFPTKTRRILFDPHRVHPSCNTYHRAVSWEEIKEIITGHAVTG